jgi:myb proto-oncogene protein
LQTHHQLLPFFPGKTAAQIAHRWRRVLDPTVVKGPWTREEEQTIIDFVAREGRSSWVKCAELIPGRTCMQCCSHWVNCLDPDLRREAWTAEEDALIARLYQRLGNCWAQIAKSLPGRTPLAIRQRWMRRLRKQANPRGESNSSDSD